MDTNAVYQDTFREELIDGEIVKMAPPPVGHVFAANSILYIFKRYLKGKKCIPFGGLLVHLTENDRFVPDMMVVCDRSKIRRNGVYGAPDLVVEVLSPSTAKNDKGYKKDVYESSGVPEYWIVDPVVRSIEVYLLRNGRYVLDNISTLYSAEELEEITDEEKAAVITEFKCHLDDDLVIRLEDIFNDWF